ncbi:ATP-binding protein [Streptomyces sp. NPDC053069]|uniref:ATP-binding protein n=1 Tax=Streptomyces sp. NPDC053069 TaxID=3365695 RepID=UPI0037D1EC4B
MPGPDPTDPRFRCVLPFEAVPTEVRLLRRAAASQMHRWGMPTCVEEAELLVTELATNVVKHVGEGTSATLVLEWRLDRLRLEVHDRSPALPSVQTRSCEEECGRGLHLIAALALDWGAVPTAAGKAVWCEVSVDSGKDCRRIERAVAVLEWYQAKARTVAWAGRSGPAALDESVVELIADLLHWTAARGQDPVDVLDRVQRHYEAELGGAA